MQRVRPLRERRRFRVAQRGVHGERAQPEVEFQLLEGQQVGREKRYVDQLHAQVIARIGGDVQQRVGARAVQRIRQRQQVAVEVVDDVERAGKVDLAPGHELLAEVDVERAQPQREVRLADQIVGVAQGQLVGRHGGAVGVDPEVPDQLQVRRPRVAGAGPDLAQRGKPRPVVGGGSILRQPVMLEPHQAAHDHLQLVGRRRRRPQHRRRQHRRRPDQQRGRTPDAPDGPPHPTPTAAAGSAG